MINVEKECGYFKGRKVAPSTDRLSGNVLNSFTSVEPHNFILTLVQGFDQTFDGYRVKTPDRICLLII
jgi:hypothetical protein